MEGPDNFSTQFLWRSLVVWSGCLLCGGWSLTSYFHYPFVQANEGEFSHDCWTDASEPNNHKKQPKGAKKCRTSGSYWCEQKTQILHVLPTQYVRSSPKRPTARADIPPGGELSLHSPFARLQLSSAVPRMSSVASESPAIHTVTAFSRRGRAIKLFLGT